MPKKLETELREALYALNRSMDALVDQKTADEAGPSWSDLYRARDQVFGVGQRLFGWRD